MPAPAKPSAPCVPEMVTSTRAASLGPSQATSVASSSPAGPRDASLTRLSTRAPARRSYSCPSCPGLSGSVAALGSPLCDYLGYGIGPSGLEQDCRLLILEIDDPLDSVIALGAQDGRGRSCSTFRQKWKVRPS